MTAFTLFHFVIAGVCFLFALVHLAMWLGVHARAQLWLSAVFLGFSLLNAGIGGSSAAAAGVAGPPTPFLFCALLAAFSLAAMVPLSPSSLDLPPTRVHQAVMALQLATSVVWVVSQGRVVLEAAGAGRVLTWEQVFDVPSWPLYLLWASLWLVPSVWVWDALRTMRTSPMASLIVLVVTVPAGIVSGREMGLMLGLVQGPSYFGLTGLPYLIFGSTVTARAFISASKLNEETLGLGRYRLIRPLGRGGMGELQLAARVGESGFTRYVAIKRILRSAAAGTGVEDRFLAEARLAAKLRHPNVVSVYDLGRAKDGWFIVMEYLSGKSLSEPRSAFRDRLDVRAVAAIGEQVARGLARAHRGGIIHRDMSPHNVMVTFDGVAKVVDFGVAKAADADAPLEASGEVGSSEVTRAGMVIGKRAYLSPEQLDGKPSSPASDQWALGVVLYECLTGRRPFDGETDVAVFQRILEDTPPPPRALRPDVPEALDAVVMRALSKDPTQRFVTCDELARALAQSALALPSLDLGEWLRREFPGAYAAEQRLEDADERVEPPAEEPKPASGDRARAELATEPARPAEKPAETVPARPGRG